MITVPGVSEAAQKIAAGTLTSQRLVEMCLEAIAERENAVGAWEHLDATTALATARRKDSEGIHGVLHGIPFGIKDIIDAAGHPTRYGSPIYSSYVSPRDAGCVALLKEAGAIFLGKTVTTEFGHVTPGRTRNPRDLKRTPGGSSSGSAAAVAAGMVPFALGTQTTGSVIRPASFCGVVGYKPSYGDVTNSGVLENASSFDTIGALCMALEDLPLIRSALLRTSARAVRAAPFDELRVGILNMSYWQVEAARMDEILVSVTDALGRKGVKIVRTGLPSDFEAIERIHRCTSGYEFARALSWERMEHQEKLSQSLVHGRMADGLTVKIEDYHKASDDLDRLRAQFDAIMTDYDALLTPAAPGEAPLGIEKTGDPIFNTIFSALHVPALTLPLFTGPNGCPIGLQIVGRSRQDERLFDVAAAIRSAIEDAG